MKKIMYFLLAAVLMTSLVSCDTLKFGVEYNLSISGDGDGNFEVTFPQGSYAMDGTATLALNVGDSILFNDANVLTKAQVLENNNPKQLAAMKAVNDSIADNFSATAGSGTYDLWIRGYVRETATGLAFRVNRHFTNREQPLRAPAAGTQVDLYPYIE